MSRTSDSVIRRGDSSHVSVSSKPSTNPVLQDWVEHLRDLPPWAKLPTEEPMSPNLRATVREQLKSAYYMRHINSYRKSLMFEWSEAGTPLESPLIQLDRPIRVLNHLAPLYWMPSATKDKDPISTIMMELTCIFKEWFKCHEKEPYIEGVNFPAVLLRVHSSGPTTVQELLAFHKLLTDRAISFEQDRATRAKWGQLNCHLRPTFPAIIMMLDHNVEPVPDPNPVPPQGPRVNADEHSKKQTVLLIRTGNDSHLESPINFGSLKESCLPIARTDVPSDLSEDVIRVSLATAVKFLSDLEQREDPDFMYPEQSKALLEQASWADSHVEKCMKKADELGIDNVYHTWWAVRRAKAAQMGESFGKLTQTPFHKRIY